jgi:hypothetical protein
MHTYTQTARAQGEHDRQTRDSRASEVAQALRGEGALAALRLLNGGTRFRFTGLYRVEPPLLRNIHLFDRENPNLIVSGAVSPLSTGYCGIACSTGEPFVTTDSRKDARLDSHPARESMISYCGVPIRARSGIAWGTLCHFDVRRRLAPPGETTLLEALVPVFTEWLGDQGLLS